MPDSKLPPSLDLRSALTEFATITTTQTHEHIKPLHRYLALRLAIEGGFHPDEIRPHPPLAVTRSSKHCLLHFDRASETEQERSVLGGLKSKAVDVVVAKEGVGPVLAISVKGTIGAFRNLTNRMEEAAGDATNIHIMYPGLVYGFLHLLKGSDARKVKLKPNDAAIMASGEVLSSIRRYHDVLLGLTGRKFIRDEGSRYEAVAVGMVDPHDNCGTLHQSFPDTQSPLHFAMFFPTLLAAYDLRYPYVAVSVAGLKRLAWATDSPALVSLRGSGGYRNLLGYEPRECEEESAEDRS
jgi:hypothetical protein